MKRYRTRLLFVMMVVLFAASGASCPFFNPPKDDLARLPPALPPSPSLQDIITVVNRNSAAIERFSSNQVSISVAGYPTLRGNVAYERPQRFRLVAGLAISFAGNEVDLGSNDEVFWFWIHRNTPPAVYYCRHDEFASSPIRNSLAFDPHLVIEAFGLVQLDPNGRYEGPFPVQGRYEIHTIRQTPEGPARKDIVVEGQQGLVVEQRIYDRAAATDCDRDHGAIPSRRLHRAHHAHADPGTIAAATVLDGDHARRGEDQRADRQPAATLGYADLPGFAAGESLPPEPRNVPRTTGGGFVSGRALARSTRAA